MRNKDKKNVLNLLTGAMIMVSGVAFIFGSPIPAGILLSFGGLFSFIKSIIETRSS